ncbi:MAG: glycogen/starch synthase [Cellvibrionaceae bacterium]
MHILMIAAENDALPGGKVGGIGDVIRDLPPALAHQGHRVSVITPGYQTLSRGKEAANQATLKTEFRGKREQVELYRVEAPRPHRNVVHWVLEHELFSAGGAGVIYHTHDREPFATDANKFVLFCSAVCEALANDLLGPVDVLHCHDWHAAPLLLLRRSMPRYRFLQELRAVYSIHNLSIQGARPLTDHQSSLESWFPRLVVDTHPITDPIHTNCINWMRTGINLADKVHAVSPNYSREILLPSEANRHFIGGEGLEADLQHAEETGRLVGILNGCDYSRVSDKPVGKSRLCRLIERSLVDWVGERCTISSAQFHALRRVTSWHQRRQMENFSVTSVGRLTDQKCRLLYEQLQGQSVLEHILDQLNDGFFVMLGSGEARYEQFFTQIMVKRENFLFLQGYSDKLAAALYSYGDLFLMPSSYEPCGISQMLAMRAGTPCLVHGVGGLADTVDDGVNGFVFRGDNLTQQTVNLIAAFRSAVKLKTDKPPRWREMCRAANAMRFTWEQSAALLIDKLYTNPETALPSGLQSRHAVSAS